MSYTNFSASTISHIIDDAVSVSSQKVFDGIGWTVVYSNGYGLDAIKHCNSYGGGKDLWEIAVVHQTPDGLELDYTTPITDDVLGFLNEKQVIDVAKRIRSLKAS